MVMEDTLLSRAPSSPRLPVSGRHSSVGISVMPGGNDSITSPNRLGVPRQASSVGVNLVHVASSPNLSSPFEAHSSQQISSLDYPPPRSLSLTNSSSQAVDLNLIKTVHTKETDYPTLVRLRSLPLDDENIKSSIINSRTQQRSLPGTPLTAPKGGIMVSNRVMNEELTLQFQLSIDNPKTETKVTTETIIASKMEVEINQRMEQPPNFEEIQGNDTEEKCENDFTDVNNSKAEPKDIENSIKLESTPIEIIVKQSSIENTERMDEDASSLVADSSCEENPPHITRTESSSSADVIETESKATESKDNSLRRGVDDDDEEEEEENIEREVKTIMEQAPTISMRIARRDYRSSQTPPTYPHDMIGDPNTQTFKHLKEKGASPFASVYSSSSSSSPYTLPPYPARSSSINTPSLSVHGSQSPFRAERASPTSTWQYAIQSARNHRYYQPTHHHTLPGNYGTKKARSISTVANPSCPYSHSQSNNPYTTTVGSSPSLSTPGTLSHHPRRDQLALHNLQLQPDPLKSKRRSVSTCNTALSVSPPCKAGRRSSGTLSEEELIGVCSPGTGSESNVTSPTPTGILSNSSAYPEKGPVERNSTNEGSPAFGAVKFRHGLDSEARARMKTGSHVRFSDDYTGLASLPPSGASRSRVQSPTSGDSNASTPIMSSVTPATRCHHLITEEGEGASSTGMSDHPHGVVRTRSNPEMECCPLCIARRECENLVKRTYSTKVAIITIGSLDYIYKQCAS